MLIDVQGIILPHGYITNNIKTSCTVLLLALIVLFSSLGEVAVGANEIIWTMDYGGKGDEIAYSIRPTTDGGYIVAGSRTDDNELQNMYLLHTDSLGNPLWDKTYGGNAEKSAHCVEQMADGGYILVGSSRSNATGKISIYIVKTDRLGNLLWDKNIAGTNNTEALAIKKSADGAVIIIGYMQNNIGFQQAYLLKMDQSGQVIWENTLVSTNTEVLRGISSTKDGGYIMTGYTETAVDGDRDLLLLKTDSAGNLQWRRVLEGNGLQCGNSIIATSEGAYVLTGYTSSSSGSETGICVVKTDANGTVLWNKNYVSGNESTGCAVEVCSDGSYMVYCRTSSDVTGIAGAYLLKLDGQGNKITDLSLGKAGPDLLTQGMSMADGSHLVLGNKSGTGEQGKNICLAKVKFSSPNAAAPVINKGSFIWPDQSEYRGDLQNGKANGWGKVSYADGGSYEGEWRNNMYNGQGTLITPDGSKYKGNFKDHMYFGKGVYTWPGGERYEGDYRYNKRNGEGTFIWPGGITYSGEWLDNQAQGYGVITWPNRETYSGEMKDGQASGLGTYTFANRETYVGQFNNLVFEGFGTYTWNNGARYVGEFKQDLMNGQGTYIWPNGVQQWGFWRDDKYIGLYPEGFGKKNQ